MKHIGREKSLNRRVSTSEYLAFISAKYEVSPAKLFQALIQAAEKKKAFCGELSIERRSERRDEVTFLIQTESKVVAQFPVSKLFLLKKGNPIGDSMGIDKVRRYLAKKARWSSVPTIKDLRSGMTQICLKAKVLEIPEPHQVYTRYGNPATVTNALIADETGTIRLCLWNEQIDSISTGDTIQIENARTTTFRGRKQLRIGRTGFLSCINESN